ncbi:hypothetical protein QF050_002288 [Arthrobacter sp. SLBN-112]|nr:hypothetical protein [Arthrobacter sp. SLBN-112]
MKNMGNRLVVLFIGMAALWQFEIARAQGAGTDPTGPRAITPSVATCPDG